MAYLMIFKVDQKSVVYTLKPALEAWGAGFYSMTSSAFTAFSNHLSGMRMVVVLCATALASEGLDMRAKLDKAQELGCRCSAGSSTPSSTIDGVIWALSVVSRLYGVSPVSGPD